MKTNLWLIGLVGMGSAFTFWAVGCTGPLQEDEHQLRRRLVASHRAYLQAVSAGPVIELSRPPSDVETELSDERRKELDKIGGPEAYRGQPLELGPDLIGNPQQTETVEMTLQQAIQLAAQNNLDVQIARIQPAINQAAIDQAEAAFDAVFFTNLDFQKLDTPQPATTPGFGQFGSVRSDERTLTTGIRKNLTSGGDMTISTELARRRRDPSFFNVKTFYDANILMTLNQPLLRGFGADVARAQILINANARREAIERLRQQLHDTLLDTETVYWGLVFARQQLLIQNRLLERTVADRDQLKQRENFDVSPVRLTEANSFVELRRADVIRARQLVRITSDRLKQLIYAKDMTVAGELLIVPLDKPVDLPVSFSLLDAVSTALRHRPLLQRALIGIDDASIEQRVADNARLPQLDLSATVRFNGLSSDKTVDDAYSNLTDGDFIDYLLSAQFEVPLGNRGPEAEFLQRQLQRRQAVIAYQRTAEQVVLEVKEALRELQQNYQLIDAARAARRAASDNLRAIEEQEEAGVALTPEFLLDLKLSTQQRLANAEIQEVQAMTDYNTAIAGFYRVMGTLLERNQIGFTDHLDQP